MELEESNTARLKVKFLDSFRTSLGNISIAAKAAGINRSSYYYWYEHDADFKLQVQEIVESVGDFVESKLLKQINEDNITGIIFFCKTKLKDRGYVERSEYTGKDEAPLHPAEIAVGVTKDTIKSIIEQINNEF